MLINIHIRISRIALHMRIKLADSSWHFFIADRNPCIAGGIDEVCRGWNELCQGPAGSQGEERSESETHRGIRGRKGDGERKRTREKTYQPVYIRTLYMV